jgi:hypothetical protein
MVHKIAGSLIHPGNQAGRLTFFISLCSLAWMALIFFVVTYFVAQAVAVLPDSSLTINGLGRLVLVGAAVGLLSTLLAWPLAISVVIFIQLNLKWRPTQWILLFFEYMSRLPLIFFVFVYLTLIGWQTFHALDRFWFDVLASPNFFTQSIAFGLTLLLYPMSVLPFLWNHLTIDEFYTKMLGGVIDFAEVGFVISLLSLSLGFYILPKMVISMMEELRLGKTDLSAEVIQSLGGSRWESTRISVLQRLGQSFYTLVNRMTRCCFFEGLISFVVLNHLIYKSHLGSTAWADTLTYVFLKQAMNMPIHKPEILVLGLVMLVVYIFSLALEFLFSAGREND